MTSPVAPARRVIDVAGRAKGVDDQGMDTINVAKIQAEEAHVLLIANHEAGVCSTCSKVTLVGNRHRVGAVGVIKHAIADVFGRDGQLNNAVEDALLGGSRLVAVAKRKCGKIYH